MATKPGGGTMGDDLPDGGYYESPTVRDEYLAFHYPDGDPLTALLGAHTPPLPERFPFVLHRHWDPAPDGRALDVGAAVGRVTFALARDHAFAVGLDLSPNLIGGACAVRAAGCARYRTVVEGDVTEAHDVAVDAPGNTAFLVGDALRLPFPDASFATVVALNLIDRVPDPRRALDELARVAAPGARILVASPYTWLTMFTPREAWLDRAEVSSYLADRCGIEGELRLPFYIPHHARTGQIAVAHVHKFRRQA